MSVVLVNDVRVLVFKLMRVEVVVADGIGRATTGGGK